MRRFIAPLPLPYASGFITLPSLSGSSSTYALLATAQLLIRWASARSVSPAQNVSRHVCYIHDVKYIMKSIGLRTFAVVMLHQIASSSASFDTGRDSVCRPRTGPPAVRTSQSDLPNASNNHLHLSRLLARTTHYLTCTDHASSNPEVLDRIEHYVATHPAPSDGAVRWIEGFGWDQTRWADWRGGFPSKVSTYLLISLARKSRRNDGNYRKTSRCALRSRECRSRFPA